MDKARVFKSKDKSDKEVVLRFVTPNQKVLTKGDFIYRQHFSKAIVAGIVTNAQANKILKDSGIWTDEQEEQAADIREKIRNLEKELSSPSLSDKDGKKICDEILKTRRDLQELTSLHSSISDNTAEQVASEARTKYFASECVVYNNNGKKVFNSLEEFENRLDEQVATDSYREALISGYERVLGIELSSDAASDYPEVKWMSERGLLPGQEKVEADEEKKPKKTTKTRKKRQTKKTTASG